MSRLFRRRQVWWPTVWGWLLLLGLLVLAVVALGLSAQPLLAPEAPAHGPDGRGARTLVVEGWLSRSELAQAADLLRHGQYERVLTSGGPIEPEFDVGGWHDFATRAAAYLKANGPANVPVIAVPAPDTPRDRTYLSALMVRDWARQSSVALGAIDVYSAGPHGRRSRLLYRMALGDAVEVGVLTARPAGFDQGRWWTSSSGAKTVLGEALALGWTNCCFWPEAAK